MYKTVFARFNISRQRCIGLVTWSALLAGCAGPGLPNWSAAPVMQKAAFAFESDASGCTGWFDKLDAVTDQAGVRDGSAHRLKAFPFLRADRFLASFSKEIAGQPLLFGVWVERLAELDLQARAVELANLPAQFLPSLAQPAQGLWSTPSTEASGDKPAIRAKTRRCSSLAQAALIQTMRADPEVSGRMWTNLEALARVPDDYSATKRALGLYPLTRLPFFAGVQRWQLAAGLKFSTTALTATPTPLFLRYQPAGEPVTVPQTTALYAGRQPDALGMARLSAQDEARLLRAYAPDLEIETRGAFDRFGGLSWAAPPAGEALPGAAAAPSVATDRPVMYQRLAYTRHHGRTLLQLVYSVWFPERPAASGMDILSGKLDSVVLRLTLAPDGTPWLYDSIHSCGCYHLFFTTPEALLKPAPQALVEWAFVPATLPALGVGQRVVMRLASGSHYVESLRALPMTTPEGPGDAGPPVAATTYALMSDQALRSLPVAGVPGGVTRSAFWPDGIVPGTERGERLLFWPMGIDSPGAMRQWGRQPTAFVGRRHFDDADLLEQRFDFAPN
jgi:hypothetical protein